MVRLDRYLTPHFRSSEVRCRCRRLDCDAHPMDQAFMAKAEQFRVKTGIAMPVDSGERCLFWNAAKGGSPHSMHLLGRALDIGLGSRDKVDLMAHLAIKAGFTGIGRGSTFLHFDDRDTPLTEWEYP